MLISLHLGVGESPPAQPPFPPQVRPSPTFRFPNGITPSCGSMSARRTLTFTASIAADMQVSFCDKDLYYHLVSFSIVAFELQFHQGQGASSTSSPSTLLVYRYYWHSYTFLSMLSYPHCPKKDNTLDKRPEL